MSGAAAEPLSAAGNSRPSIGTADIGHRIVVRRRLPGRSGPTGGQAYSDVLGILQSWDRQTLRVRRADDAIVEIPISEVARAKRVPAAPAKRSSGQREA